MTHKATNFIHCNPRNHSAVKPMLNGLVHIFITVMN